MFKQLEFEWAPAPARTVAAEWNKPLRDALARSEMDTHPPVEGREMTLEEEMGW